MKKTGLCILWAALLIPVIVSAQNSPGYTITGQIDGLKDGEKVKMLLQGKVLNSCIAHNGGFRFQGALSDGPREIQLNFCDSAGWVAIDRSRSLSFLMNNDDITLRGRIKAGKAAVETIAVEGSRAEEDKRALLQLILVWGRTLDRLYGGRDYLNNDSVTYNRGVIEAAEHTKELFQTNLQVAFSNVRNEVIPYLFDTYGYIIGKESIFPGLYERMDEQLKESYYGKRMQERLPLCKGQPAPEFSSTTPDGKKLTLKAVVAKNKLTLIDFWASYCPPCRNEFKTNVIPLYNEYHKEGFEVIAVSCDDNAEKWKKAIADDRQPWLQVSSLTGLDKFSFHDSVFKLYKISKTPTNVLVDQQGKILAWNVKGVELHWYLDKVCNGASTISSYIFDRGDTLSPYTLNQFPDVARMIKAQYPDKADSLLRIMAQSICRRPDVTEKQLICVQKVYSSFLADFRSADSLQQAIVKKFPGGLAYRLQMLHRIVFDQDTAERARLYTRFFADFPLSRYPYEEYMDVAFGDNIAAGAYMGWGYLTFKRHRWNDLYKIIRQSPYAYLTGFYQQLVKLSFPVDERPVISLPQALAISSLITGEMTRRSQPADPAAPERGVYAPTEWHLHPKPAETFVYVFHIGLLYQDGQYQKGLELAEKLKPFVGVSSIPFNDHYVGLLHKLRKEEQAIAFVKEAIYANAATPGMVDLLKEDYRQIKNSQGMGFLDYYRSLQSAQVVEKEHTQLAKSMVRIPSVAFELPDMKDRMVNLTGLKGKIVVLDFWATWCTHCKEAMPGMQMAVNKYKQDTSVVFYFVSTMETLPDYKQKIVAYMKQKNYNFNVLCDDLPDTAVAFRFSQHEKGEVYGRFAHLFHLGGIPEKIIIDQAGMVRWISPAGFNGNTMELADEISYLVDRLKGEKDDSML